MSVVVDASVVVAALTDTGPAGAWAEEIVEAGEIVAPDLVLVEATNIFWELRPNVSSYDAWYTGMRNRCGRLSPPSTGG